MATQTPLTIEKYNSLFTRVKSNPQKYGCGRCGFQRVLWK